MELKKAKSFYSLKEECALLTRVAEEGKVAGDDYSWLTNNLEDIKVALTNLQVVAREYRKAEKVVNLKSEQYRAKRIQAVNGTCRNSLDKRVCFFQEFKNLTSKNLLVVIRVASKKLANQAMKEYRHTAQEEAKRAYSAYRALDQQIKRLDTTLGKKVYELANKQELEAEAKKEEARTTKVTEWHGIRTTKKLVDGKWVVVKTKRIKG